MSNNIHIIYVQYPYNIIKNLNQYKKNKSSQIKCTSMIRQSYAMIVEPSWPSPIAAALNIEGPVFDTGPKPLYWVISSNL